MTITTIMFILIVHTSPDPGGPPWSDVLQFGYSSMAECERARIPMLTVPFITGPGTTESGVCLSVTP